MLCFALLYSVELSEIRLNCKIRNNESFWGWIEGCLMSTGGIFGAVSGWMGGKVRCKEAN